MHHVYMDIYVCLWHPGKQLCYCFFTIHYLCKLEIPTDRGVNSYKTKDVKYKVCPLHFLVKYILTKVLKTAQDSGDPSTSQVIANNNILGNSLAEPSSS